jgi:hypothetical protein
MRKMVCFISSVLDRLCVIVGAFVGSQIPQFMQQYSQRLAGHVDELQHLLDNLRQLAAHSDKTLEQYIQKFVTNADPDFARQGHFMQHLMGRWQELEHALYHLTHSSIWARPYVFLKELQADIAQATLFSFQPGISLNLEGLCYAGGGVLIGLAFYHLVEKGATTGFSRAMAIVKPGV